MLHRLVVAVGRRLALDRNPMRRRVDRFEAWLSALTVLVLLVVAPVIGARFADARLAGQQAQAQTSPAYKVTATVGRDPGRSGPSEMAGPRTVRDAQWVAPDGTPRRGTVSVPYGTRYGRTVTIWTDAHGHVRAHPSTAAQMRANATVFGGFVGVAVVLGGLAVIWLGRRLLDRRRFADWDAEWATTAPRWMRQY